MNGGAAKEEMVQMLPLSRYQLDRLETMAELKLLGILPEPSAPRGNMDCRPSYKFRAHRKTRRKMQAEARRRNRRR